LLCDAARRYVIAEIQHITFNEYLFWLLGRPFPKDDYYDSECDPRVHIFFSTVAFRYGHSECSDYITSMEKGEYGNFPKWHYNKVYHHFFDPYFVEDVALCDVFEGLAGTVQQSPDAQIADSLRNNLWRKPHSHPYLDLFAIDIQRGRDHKIPTFNHVRKAYGLDTVETWDDFKALTKALGQNETELKLDLAKVYRSPWEADCIVAGLATDWNRSAFSKKHHDYSNLGDLFEAAVISQFQRTRTGDKYWYSRNLDQINCDGLTPVQERTLADVIRDNIDNVNIPDDVFKVKK